MDGRLQVSPGTEVGKGQHSLNSQIRGKKCVVPGKAEFVKEHGRKRGPHSKLHFHTLRIQPPPCPISWAFLSSLEGNSHVSSIP